MCLSFYIVPQTSHYLNPEKEKTVTIFDRQFVCNEIPYHWITEKPGWKKALILTEEAQTAFDSWDLGLSWLRALNKSTWAKLWHLGEIWNRTIIVKSSWDANSYQRL